MDKNFRERAYYYAKSKNSGAPDADDFAQTATMSIMGGRKATLKQLYVDFLRATMGDSRHPASMTRNTSLYGDMVEIEGMLPVHESQAEQCDFGVMLDKVNSEDRPLLVLKFLWGLSEKEIGYCFGVSESRISQKLTEIKKRLTKRFKDC